MPRAFTGLLALVLLTAIPGVAIASLPAHPAPTHECCAAPEAMPPSADCETAPCCIEKPAPRAPSVLTGGDALAVPAVAAIQPDALPAPAASAPAHAPVVPRARSAPLFLLFVTLLI
jgi:hypothetical protein